MFRRPPPSPIDASTASALLQVSLHAAPLWVFEQDAELRYTWLQNADTAGDAGASTDLDLMERREEAEQVLAVKREVLRTGLARTVELVSHVSGEARRHRLFVEPLRDGRGEVVGLRGAVADLGPEAPAAEAQTQSLLRLVGHELRNAVNPVRMLVQLERRRVEAGRPASEALAHAYPSVERLTAALEDMLDYARSTVEALPVELAPVALEPTLAEVAARFEVLHPEHDGRLVVAPPPPGAEVHADPARLRQALLALLERAARTSEPHARISVAGFVDASMATVEIVDEGIGLPSRADERSRDPVAWAATCLAEQRDEPPFAFPLVHQLAAAMGGRLELEPGPRGVGTRAALRLPLAGDRIGRRRAGSPAADPAARIPPLDILVVDDSPGATQTLRMLLETDGHRVREAQTGAACLEAVRAHALDVVFLDLGLPDIGGLEVARRIRAERADGPALIGLTGRSSAADRRASDDAGLDRHLVKPVALADLRAALAQVVPRA